MGIFCPFLHFSLYLCTMKLHIFNPEHDLALAANLKQFTAPHAGRQLRSDLAFIPALWAEEGDLVLVDDIDFAKNRVRHFGAELNSKVEFITKPQLKHMLKTEFLDSVHPWGWNLSLKGELERLGMPEIMLPTDAVLNKVREVSSRQWAALHLQRGVEYVAETTRVKELILQHGKAVVKAPWSSSGRGVKYVSAEDFRTAGDYPSFERWVANMIYHQGGVTVEPLYNKVRDFAMEFEMKDGKALYRGLSLFDTIKNAYSGNVLCSEDDKVEMMKPLISEAQLAGIRQRIIEVMEPALKNIYSGPFGVDMMICTKGEKDEFCEAVLNQEGEDVNRTGLGVVSCIEINLRRTMGHVAIDLYEHLVANSSDEMKTNRTNIMRVEYDGNRYHLRIKPGRPSEEAPLH